jgi:hypothetical protein
MPLLIFAAMVIAINLRSLSGNTASGIFLENCFIHLAHAQPLHQFVFITENPPSSQIPFSKNIKTKLLPLQSKTPLFWKLWYNYKLPSLLKKINADILVSGDAVCSLRCKLPQLLFIDALSFLQKPVFYPSNYVRFMKKNIASFLAKPKGLFTSSDFFKNEIIQRYKTDAGKITVLLPGTDQHYQTLTWEEKEKVKESYSAGKEYFLFSGPVNQSSNLIHLLKAFSVFKKRQKTNMQLIITCAGEIKDQQLAGSLKTYKFKNEVILWTHVTSPFVDTEDYNKAIEEVNKYKNKDKRISDSISFTTFFNFIIGVLPIASSTDLSNFCILKPYIHNIKLYLLPIFS